jgi:hypothetical protein
MNRLANHQPKVRCRWTQTVRLVMHKLVVLSVLSAASVSVSGESVAVDNATMRESLAHAVLLRDSALSGSQAMEIVTSLTTEVGPRLAGSAAETRAREWAVKRLADLGLQQIRTEDFEMSAWQRHSEHAEIVTPFPQPLAVTALGGSVSTAAAGLTGEVVLFNSLPALRAATPEAVAGKIVYVGHTMQRTQDGSSYGYFNPVRTAGPSVAAQKGAIAYLLRSIGTDSHRFPHTGSLRYAENTPRIPALALSNPDADQLERILAGDSGLIVRLQVETSIIPAAQSANVIAEIRGHAAPEEVVVIGAHLDSWDLGTGAIDDGAGVGITMAAMALIQEAGLSPRRTIRLVLWGAEEVGLLGALAYRDQHATELGDHIIGSESDFGGGRVWKITADSQTEAGDQLFAHMADLLAPLGIAPGSNKQPGGGPDLMPLVPTGVPTLRLHQDGRDYFDLHHTADDTVDKLDAPSLDQNVAAFAVVTWLAANSDVTFRKAP